MYLRLANSTCGFQMTKPDELIYKNQTGQGNRGQKKQVRNPIPMNTFKRLHLVQPELADPE